MDKLAEPLAPSDDHYQTLGVPRTATPDQIRLAYRRAVKICHPDHNHNDPKAAKLFRELTTAYKALRDPEQRLALDTALGIGHTFRPWYASEKKAEDQAREIDPSLQGFHKTAATLASDGLSASEVAGKLIEADCAYETAWEIAWQARHDQMSMRMEYADSSRSTLRPSQAEGSWHPHQNTLWEKLRHSVSRIFS